MANKDIDNICGCLQCVINSKILTTKQLILYWYCKEKMDVDKLAWAAIEKEKGSRVVLCLDFWMV